MLGQMITKETIKRVEKMFGNLKNNKIYQTDKSYASAVDKIHSSAARGDVKEVNDMVHQWRTGRAKSIHQSTAWDEGMTSNPKKVGEARTGDAINYRRPLRGKDIYD